MTIETFEELVLDVIEAPVVGSSLLIRRVSMDPAKVDENVDFFKREVLPQIKANPGFRAAREMINRQTGEGMVGTVWTDDDLDGVGGRSRRGASSAGCAAGGDFRRAEPTRDRVRRPTLDRGARRGSEADCTWIEDIPQRGDLRAQVGAPQRFTASHGRSLRPVVDFTSLLNR